ncbi:MAG: hypothetical protein ACHRXM_04615 [Isosphaerales bacterium]
MPRRGQDSSAPGIALGSAGWRLGLGPVFAYEWITSSRRRQGYALRSSFVLLLLVALLVIWKTTSPRGGENDLRFMARLGEFFFLGVIGTQLTLVLLAAPAATAGAICLDHARGTLTHILVTDLSDAEIVLGKLAARLVPVLGLVACTLPMMELLTLLGGVDPVALLGAFVVTLGVAVLGCSLALVFSLWAGKTHEALLGTYAVWGLWLLGRPMLTQLGLALGWSVPLPPRTADPFLLAFAPYWWPGSDSWSDYLLFLGVTSTISALLTALGILRLRSVCTREPVRRARSPSSRLPVGKIGRLIQSLLRWTGPSLERAPVLWREWHRSRPSRWASMVTAVYITLASVFSVATIVSPSRPMAAWVNGLQVSVGLLILSVTAATSLAEERVRGSLDVLMTTPLSSRQIVLGKWLGTYRRVPLLAILPGLVIWGGVSNVKPATVAAVVLMTAYVLCAGAAITSLGLAMATWFSRLGRSVGMTVSLYVLVAVGWSYLMLVLFGPGRGEGIAMGSPFFWAGGMSYELARSKSLDVRNIDWAIFWLIVCALGAAGLLTITLASFDRCLGRVEDVFTRLARPSRRARIVATVYFSLGMVLSLGAILWRATDELTIAINGLQFTGGLLLLALTAASSLAEERHMESAGLLMTTPVSTPWIVFAKWLGTCWMVPPLVFLPVLVVAGRRAPDFVDWLGLLAIIVYMLSISAAAISLGLACGTWFSRRSRAFGLTVGLVALVSVAGLVLANRRFPISPPNLDWSSPFFGLSVMILELGGSHSANLDLTWWAMIWSLVYGLSAVVLLGAAIATFDRCLGRVAKKPPCWGTSDEMLLK